VYNTTPIEQEASGRLQRALTPELMMLIVLVVVVVSGWSTRVEIDVSYDVTALV